MHSLNAQDYVLNLNSDTVYQLLKALKENKEEVAVTRPAETDPLYMILKDIKLKDIKS